MQFNRYDIPGFREAVKAENDARDAAFLNIPADICGIKIRQMTPRDFLILDGTGNPIISGGIPTTDSISDFLHFMDAGNSRLRRFWKMLRLDYVKALEAIGKYLEVTFQDTPGGTKSARSIPIASWFAHRAYFLLSHNLCRSIEEALDISFRVHNQIINCALKEIDPHYQVNARHGKIEKSRLELKNVRMQLLQLLAHRTEVGN